jgi:hypothetical protein
MSAARTRRHRWRCASPACFETKTASGSYVARQLLRRPGHTLAVIACLAIALVASVGGLGHHLALLRRHARHCRPSLARACLPALRQPHGARWRRPADRHGTVLVRRLRDRAGAAGGFGRRPRTSCISNRSDRYSAAGVGWRSRDAETTRVTPTLRAARSSGRPPSLYGRESTRRRERRQSEAPPRARLSPDRSAPRQREGR